VNADPFTTSFGIRIHRHRIVHRFSPDSSFSPAFAGIKVW
jgi:hypothetical protein